ncbi:MAG: NAD-dependent epimerase/dehydratase family protein [Capsulimonadales bacterium]|nr:NAD-dependent epimerase/dehydratase family protein [Capsulimonadales bacterium]
MRILILGGTIFLGRHLTEAALERRHEVTLFNRGKHNPDWFPEVEKIRGDRRNPEELRPLAEREWDAVIDTCGYIPREVTASASLLADRTKLYCFISSVSVYRDYRTENMDESAALGTMDDPTVEEVNGDTYGPLKALCERAAEAALPGRTQVLRPGLIVGPYDVSDRFSYWPKRIAEGGEVLVPDDPERGVQIIDVRDLAEWNIRLIERGVTGTFNVCGPDYPLTMDELMDTCRTVTSSDATFTYVSEDFLQEQGVTPWSELPLWVPSEMGRGFDTISIAKALKHGLSIRPLSETVHDTLLWDLGRPKEGTYRNTLTREKEQTVLSAWKTRPTAG